MRNDAKTDFFSIQHSAFRILVLLLALLSANVAFALDVPPPPTQWVTDRAELLDASQEISLNTKLKNFEQQSGAQFIIYTFPSLEGESVEDFTIRCVERWKVGQKKYDNGLVVFVFREERVIRIETGYGLEGSVTDAVSSRVIRESIAPHFQAGNWFAGLNAGADALIARITSGEAPVPPAQGPQGRGAAPQADINPIFILLILFFVFFILVPALTRGGGRGRGGCGGCFWPMFFFPGGGGGITFGGGGFSGGGGGWGGGGGFSGGGGGFGGGGATGGW